MSNSNARGKIRQAKTLSSLGDWMRENFSWFHAEILEAVRPDWRLIAKTIHDEDGVLDRSKNPPSAEAVRKMYESVRDSKSKSKPKPSPQPVIAAAPIPQPVTAEQAILNLRNKMRNNVK